MLPEAPHDWAGWTENSSSGSQRIFAIVCDELFRPSLLSGSRPLTLGVKAINSRCQGHSRPDTKQVTPDLIGGPCLRPPWMPHARAWPPFGIWRKYLAASQLSPKTVPKGVDKCRDKPRKARQIRAGGACLKSRQPERCGSGQGGLPAGCAGLKFRPLANKA